MFGAINLYYLYGGIGLYCVDLYCVYGAIELYYVYVVIDLYCVCETIGFVFCVWHSGFVLCV